jgi:hypothetical protein
MRDEATEAYKCEEEDSVCKGCGGEQCSGCRATVGFTCCMSKAGNDASKKSACCMDNDYKLANKGEACSACQSFDDECKGCSGEACSGCNATVAFDCCMANAQTVSDQGACCVNDDYNLAKKGDRCGDGAKKCATHEEKCGGCSGEQCSSCNATVDFDCCMAMATTDDDKSECCWRDSFKGANKKDACDAFTAPNSTACSKAGDGCLNTQCCEDPKLTCFKKNDHWADCKPSCEKGKVDPNSPKEHQSPWSCDVLGKCSAAGQGCMDTGCCQDSSLTCFVKNEYWADCKKSCEPGKVDPNSPADMQSPWTCEKKVCSEAGKGCMKTGCCQDRRLTCFVKNDHWADCKRTCEPGKVDPNSPKDQQSPWRCTVL